MKVVRIESKTCRPNEARFAILKITRRKKVVAAVLALLLFFPALCFVDSLRYPPIVRYAYWRHPVLLAKATVTCLFPGEGVSKDVIVAHAKELGRTDDLSAHLLYLPDVPADTPDSKTFKSRVFGLVMKRVVDTKEQLFWLVTPHSHGRIPNDHTLAYEYKTGRLVCIEDHSRVGEFAVNK